MSYEGCNVSKPKNWKGLRVFNVWHIGAWNRNVGDWALAYQMHRLLNEQAYPKGITFKFYLLDSQRTSFHPGLIDQMNEEADLILVGGGGLIFFRPEDRSVSGWSFNINTSDLERVQPPIIVYGIGYNKFLFDKTDFPPETGPHLRQLQTKAELFSVRNKGTAKILVEQYGLDRQRVGVVPDPGICLYDRPILIPARRKDGPIIAINWAGDRPEHRYPEPPEENMRYFMLAAKQALLLCVKRLGAQIMFLPHLLHVDSDMYTDFSRGFSEGSVFSTHIELPFLYPPPGELLYPHVPFFTNIFRQADLVIGMRLHTCVLSFGAATRFIPLGSHPKLRYFLDDVGVPDYSSPLVDPFQETADYLFENIKACLDDSEYKAILDCSLGKQLQVLRDFNEQVFDLLKFN